MSISEAENRFIEFWSYAHMGRLHQVRSGEFTIPLAHKGTRTIITIGPTDGADLEAEALFRLRGWMIMKFDVEQVEHYPITCINKTKEAILTRRAESISRGVRSMLFTTLLFRR